MAECIICDTPISGTPRFGLGHVANGEWQYVELVTCDYEGASWYFCRACVEKTTFAQFLTMMGVL